MTDRRGGAEMVDTESGFRQKRRGEDKGGEGTRARGGGGGGPWMLNKGSVSNVAVVEGGWGGWSGARFWPREALGGGMGGGEGG